VEPRSHDSVEWHGIVINYKPTTFL